VATPPLPDTPPEGRAGRYIILLQAPTPQGTDSAEQERQASPSSTQTPTTTTALPLPWQGSPP
jgi:hypothetical protein